MDQRILNVGVRACQALYEPVPEHLEDQNVFDVQGVERSDVKVMMFGYKLSNFENVSIVVVQGSNHINDWLKYNLHVKQVDGVQAGFQAAFEEVRKDVERYTTHRLETYFFGHSLGGAVAMLLADDTYTPWVGGVATFGQPRVFSPARASSYDARLGDKTMRYVLRNDFVPFVPWALGTYRHTKNETILGGTKRGIVGSLVSLFPKLFNLTKSDHAIGGYVDAIINDKTGV